MKRKRDSDEPAQDNEDRAQKYQKALSVPVLELSDDEWSHVAGYLSIGENIMVALSCKPLYDIIARITQTKQPKVAVKEWSIFNALIANRQGLNIDSAEERNTVMDYVEKNQFHLICPAGKIRNERFASNSVL
jgi:hypothetical protein